MQNETIDNQTRIDLLKLLLKSQAFDHFLASKFPTFKRYSLEGGESSLAFYHSLFENAAKSILFFYNFYLLISRNNFFRAHKRTLWVHISVHPPESGHQGGSKISRLTNIL